MTRPTQFLSRLALCAALSLAAPAAHAQYGTPQFGQPQYGAPYGQQQYGAPYGQPQNGQQNARQDADAGDKEGLLPLPQGVRRVVGIDAQNVLLAELEPQVEGGPTEYRAIPVQHVYVGGIARLFGGTTISTEEFVSPAYSKNGGQNGNNFNGQNGQNGFNQNNGFNNGGPVFGSSNPNGVYPGSALPYGYAPNSGYPQSGTNLGPSFGGGFSGAPQVVPQVTYGVGNLIRSRQAPFQNRGYSVVQGR